MASSIGRVATALSDGAWLDGGRARAYTRILLALTLLGAVGWTALSSGGLDREGKPIGTDFVGFYAASGLALDGRPELAYDVVSALGGAEGLVRPEARLYRVLLPAAGASHLAAAGACALFLVARGVADDDRLRVLSRPADAICRRSSRRHSSPFPPCS